MRSRSQILGYPGYTITVEGVVYGKQGHALATRQHHRTGHHRVRLYGRHLPKQPDGRHYQDVYVHVLVCLTFHGPRPFPGALVCHFDDDPTNNHADNLRWDTREANAADRRRNNGGRY